MILEAIALHIKRDKVYFKKENRSNAFIADQGWPIKSPLLKIDDVLSSSQTWHLIKKRSLLHSAGLWSNKCRWDGIVFFSKCCSVISLCGSSPAVFATSLSGPTNVRTTEDHCLPAILQNHNISKHAKSCKPRICCRWVSAVRSFD